MGIPEVILIVGVGLLLFGAKRIPGVGTFIGKAVREFKKAARVSQAKGDESNDESS